MHFDLLVLGSGPAGQKAAVQAAKLGKRAAVVERMSTVGGVSIHTGTIPSKTLREAAMYLTGYHQRGVYGQSYRVKSEITMGDLMMRAEHVIRQQIEVTRHHLRKNDIEVFTGDAVFVDPHTVAVSLADGTEALVTADRIMIATGSEAARDAQMPFDSDHVMTSDELLHLPGVPASLAIIGGGIIGIEYAGIFAALGVPVTLIDRRPTVLPFLDREIADHLIRDMHEAGVEFLLGEDVAAVLSGSDVEVRLKSGKAVHASAMLYAVGRVGATATLNLGAAGLQADDRGRLPVDAHYQTAVPHIYAAGDVIGHPALAATSMDQGRVAVCHAFDVPEQTAQVPLPYGVYTIPEIATIGPTSEELGASGVAYVTGRASYREIARGQILGDETGFLKLLFHQDTGRLLGVHAIGIQASELIHIGQAVIAFGGGIDYFIDTVFNYPTLAECYKSAALDAANEMRKRGVYASIEAFHPAPPVV